MKKVFTIVLTVLMALLFGVNVGATSLDEKPSIVSEAAVLMDSKSGAILFDKNADQIMYPASLTKIATAIYALEKGNLKDEVRVSKEALQVEGTRVYLEEGEVATLEHLLQGMLINSGNDAAAAIAIFLDGSIENFSKNINDYLEDKVGVQHTHLTNPHGLFAEDHYTTARDMAIITNFALKNPTFKSIFGTKELVWDGLSWDTTLVTHHYMLKGELPYDGIIGGKTGFVNESKQTLATVAENNQIQLTAIVLKADYKKDIYHDTQLLFDYGFQNFKTEQVSKDTIFAIKNQEFTPKDDLFMTIPLAEFTREVNSKGELKISASNGDKIQTIQLEEIKEEPVVKQNVQSGIYGDPQYALLIAVVLGVATVIITIRKKSLQRSEN